MAYVLENGMVAFAPWVGIGLWEIEELLSWNTEVLAAADRTEQRIAKRLAWPRQTLIVPQLCRDDGENARLDGVLHAWSKRPWPAPCWHEATRLDVPIPPESESIAFDTAWADYRDASYACLWSRAGYEIVAIETVEPDGLTLAEPTALEFQPPVWILPVRQAYLAGAVPVERYLGGAGIVRLSFAALDNRLIERSAPEQAVLWTYDGLEVLPDAMRMTESSWRTGHDPDVIWQDHGTGPFTVRSVSDFPETVQPHEWQWTTPPAAWLLRQFLHARQGRQVPFLAPTWRRDLVLSRIYTSGTSLYVTHASLAAHYGVNALRRYVMARPPDSAPVIRRVTGMQAVSDEEEEIEVDDALGVALAEGSALSWTDKCRLASDEVRLTWRGRGQGHCKTSFVRVTG